MDYIKMLKTGAILYRRVQSGAVPHMTHSMITVAYCLQTSDGIVLSGARGDKVYDPDLCDFASYWHSFTYSGTQAALRKVAELNQLQNAQVLDIFFNPKNTRIIWDNSISVRQFVEPPKEDPVS
jgi:hypothetical protein